MIPTSNEYFLADGVGNSRVVAGPFPSPDAAALEINKWSIAEDLEIISVDLGPSAAADIKAFLRQRDDALEDAIETRAHELEARGFTTDYAWQRAQDELCPIPKHHPKQGATQ